LPANFIDGVPFVVKEGKEGRKGEDFGAYTPRFPEVESPEGAMHGGNTE